MYLESRARLRSVFSCAMLFNLFFWTEWALGDLMALGVVISGDSVYCVCELSVIQTWGLEASRRLENALDIGGSVHNHNTGNCPAQFGN